MNRLYTFGCSFSSQIYPTWNEILGLYFDHHYNLGKGGAGNKYIFTALLSLLAEGKIAQSDTVVVQWSSTHRYDWYRDGSWRCYGNMLNRSDLPRELGELWYDEIAGTIDSCAYVSAASRLLDACGCTWYMACFHDITQPMSWESTPITCNEPLIQRFRQDIQQWEDHWATKPIYSYCFDSGLDFKTWEFDDGTINLDPHPTPMMAYKWLCECLLPMMDLDPMHVVDQVHKWQAQHDTVTRMRDLRTVYKDLQHRWTSPERYRDSNYLDRS